VLLLIKAYVTIICSYQFLAHSMFFWILTTYTEIHFQTIHKHTHTHVCIQIRDKPMFLYQRYIYTVKIQIFGMNYELITDQDGANLQHNYTASNIYLSTFHYKNLIKITTVQIHVTLLYIICYSVTQKLRITLKENMRNQIQIVLIMLQFCLKYKKSHYDTTVVMSTKRCKLLRVHSNPAHILLVLNLQKNVRWQICNSQTHIIIHFQ